MTTLGRTVTRGVVWNGLQVILSKSFSFVSQLVLGWLLAKEDFGLFALAIASATFVTALKYGGTEQVLMQKGPRFFAYAPTVLRIATIFNAAAALLLVTCANPIASFYGEPRLVPLLFVIAFALVLSIPTVVFRSKLSVDLKFGQIAKVDAASALIRHSSMIVFALSGYGALSFVLPLLVVAVFEAVAFGVYARYLPVRKDAGDVVSMGAVLRESRWLMLGTFGVGLANFGDYMVLGLFIDQAQLGVYFFGFQLVASFAGLFDMSIRHVMLPSLSAVTNDVPRQAAAFVKALRTLSLVTAIFAVLVALVTPALVEVMWAGKWNDAIIVVQVIAFAIPTWCYSSLSLALMGARALWRVRTLFSIADGMTLMIAAAVGAWVGGLFAIALAVTLQRAMFAFILTQYATRTVNVTTRDLFAAVYKYVVVIYAVAGASYLLSMSLAPYFNEMVVAIMQSAAVATILLLLAKTVLREQVGEIVATLKRAFTQA